MEIATPWDLIKSYRWKSVFFSYLRYLFLIILILLIPFGLLIYFYYDYAFENEIAQYSTSNLTKSTALFEVLISDFDENYRTIIQDRYLKPFLSMRETQIENHAYLDNVAQSVMAMKGGIARNIYLYSFSADYVVSSEGCGPSSLFADSMWMKTYRATNAQMYIIPRKVYSQEYDTIYLCRQVVQQNKLTGLFCLELNYRDFTNIIKKSFAGNTDHLYIISNIGVILYSDDSTLINTPVYKNRELAKIFEQFRGTQSGTLLQDGYIISTTASKNSQILLVTYLKKDRLLNTRQDIQLLLIAGSCTALVIAVLIALFISFKMYKNVVDIVFLLQNPQYRPAKESSLGELFLIRSDLSQRETIHHQEMEKQLWELKKAQAIALQTQINPHFLFNTLQLVNMSVMKEIRHDNEAVRIVQLLSDLLRLSYSTHTYLIPVSQELEHIEKYLEIQKIRYKNRLQISVDVPAECMGKRTVKLLLQPIVENSIRHGLSDKKEDWLLKIQCRLEGDGQFLCFSIEDNGVGMDPELLAALRQDLKSMVIREDSHIGISNINQRLRLIFGSNFSLNIDSAPNQGTVVTLRHPLLDDQAASLYNGKPEEKKW